MINILLVGESKHFEKSLFSIAIQTVKEEMSVIMVSSKKHDLSSFQKKIKIEEVITKEKSMGKRREIALQRAKGDYVLFMNSGDVFYDVFALNNLYKNVEGYDVVIGGIENRERQYSCNYLVGNLYRRKYLTSHKLVFHDSDGPENGFHKLVFMSGADIVYSSDIIYHENTSIREDNDWVLEDAVFAVNLAKKRDYSPHNIALMIYDTVVYYAHLYHQNQLSNGNYKDFISLYYEYQKYLSEEDYQYISDINLTNREVDDFYCTKFIEDFY